MIMKSNILLNQHHYVLPTPLLEQTLQRIRVTISFDALLKTVYHLNDYFLLWGIGL